MTVAAPQPNTPPRKRRWYQFSLRTLMIVMLLASVGMSFLAVRMQRAKRQSEAVEAITKAGGHVVYDFEVDSSGNRIANSLPPQPSWLLKVFGQDFFCDVVQAAPATSDSLKHIDKLPRLRILILSPLTGFRDEFTADALRSIERCRSLEELCLLSCDLGDSGLKHLAQLDRLRHLEIQEASITDAGMGHLRTLQRLETLDLRFNPITNVGLRRLEGLHGLRSLRLFGTEVTDEGVREFQGALPNCEVDRKSLFAL